MFLLLFLLFTAVPVFELYLLFQASSTLGLLNTIAIVIMTGVIGAALAKSQGLSILSEIQSKTKKGEIPADSLVHAFLVFAGGLLLLTPGFVTDTLGFSMVLPFTRKLYVLWAKKALERKILKGEVKFYSSHQVYDVRSEMKNPYTESTGVKEIHPTKVIDITDEAIKKD